MNSIYQTLVKLNSLQFKYRTIISFVIVFITMVFIDIAFYTNFDFISNFFFKNFNVDLSNPDAIDLTFAPEIWGGVLAMVLGTLIIVIAIAAESSPKLMDLFVKDWLSLIYVWFLILASLHAVLIMFYVAPSWQSLKFSFKHIYLSIFSFLIYTSLHLLYSIIFQN